MLKPRAPLAPAAPISDMRRPVAEAPPGSAASGNAARLRRVLGIAILLAGLVPSATSGQETEASESVPEAPEVPAIAASEIAVEADRTERRLVTFEESIEPDERIAEISGELSEVAAALDAETARAEALDEDASLEDLSQLASNWSAAGAELPGWREAISARATAVDLVLSELDDLAATWKATEDAAAASEAPAPILSGTADVRTAIAATRARAIDRRSALLGLQVAVAHEESRVTAALASLEKAREGLVRRVFESDAEPLWSPGWIQRLTDRFGERGRAAVQGEVDTIQRFVAGNRGPLLFQLALFLVLGVLLRAARERVRRRTEEEHGLDRVADVFEFPLAIALLLTLASSLWIYPYLPRAVNQILGAAVLVPAVFIRRLSTPTFLPILNALVMFYFIDRLRELAAPLPALARLIFLAEMAGGVLLTVWLLQPARTAGIPPALLETRVVSVLGKAIRVGLVLFSISFLADALGYRRLGLLVGGSALKSAYIGAVAYAAVQIIDSLVTFALRVQPLTALRMVRRGRYDIQKGVHRVLTFTAVAIWGLMTLDLVALRRPLVDQTVAFFTHAVEVGSLSVSLGDVVLFVFTIWLAFRVSRFLRYALEEDVYPRMKLARGVPYAASSFLHYGILLLGFFVAIAATGIDLDRFAIIAGAFSVGIGFGLQNVVNNFVSGLILLTERPVQVGDTIDSGGLLCEVKRIGIRSSTVRSWSGAEVIVPNSELISQRVINWTLSDRQRRLEVPVGVAYGTDRAKVLEILTTVASEHPDVMANPPAAPIFLGFGASSLDFELRAWTANVEDYVKTQSELAMAIGDAIEEAGIEIPFPQRDLHVRSIDSKAAASLSTGPRSDGD